MTSIYLIRHAESNHLIQDDRIRPLTDKGLADRILVTDYLRNKNIDVVFSSPFKRAVDTVSDFAAEHNIEIKKIEGFRESNSGYYKAIGLGYNEFAKLQWANFFYKLSDGESLAEVQTRNIIELNKILAEYQNKNIVIGTHGVALSTIINYYDNQYNYEDFLSIAKLLPWAVKITFNDYRCVEMEKIDLFKGGRANN